MDLELVHAIAQKIEVGSMMDEILQFQHLTYMHDS